MVLLLLIALALVATKALWALSAWYEWTAVGIAAAVLMVQRAIAKPRAGASEIPDDGKEPA